MRKKILLLSILLVMTSLSYPATKPSLEASLNSIENKFNDLLEKEAQKKNMNTCLMHREKRPRRKLIIMIANRWSFML